MKATSSSLHGTSSRSRKDLCISLKPKGQGVEPSAQDTTSFRPILPLEPATATIYPQKIV